MRATIPALAIEGGTIWLLRLLDIADVVDLEAARRLTESRGARRGTATMRGPDKAPGGVALATQPLDVDVGDVLIGGVSLRASVRMFDFGAVSVRFVLPLSPGTTIGELIEMAARLERLAGLDAAAREIGDRISSELRPALQGRHAIDLIEDYAVFEVSRVSGCPSAAEALAAIDPARLLLAEPARELAPAVAERYRERAIQYFADDAAVIAWNAALVIDPEGSRDELEVLEIATARLLELRYYDQLLGRELGDLYTAAVAARSSSTVLRSPFVKVARKAATLFVEIADLYDRAEGALTLVGDAYTARIYREAARQFRLDEISTAVKEKLGTLARVSEVFEGEIANRRTIILETAIVLLIVLEVVLGLLRVS